MKKSFFVFFVFAYLMVYKANAQQEGNIWYFGRYAGLDFSFDTVVALQNSAMWANDNSSTISDLNGQLLFYTNADTVWNRLHQIMPGGTGLASDLSSGQCAVIVPQPGTTRYYLFTNSHFTSDQGLCFSIVEIAEDHGYGAVVQKNTQLFPNTTEKLDAIYNSKDNSFWIITHPFESRHFFTYKLTSSGLSNKPVISDPCALYSGGDPYGYNAIGQMTISPDGKMIASGVLSDGFIELCDFNMSTGKITNSRILPDNPNTWGIAFSSNSKMLYATKWWSDNVFQFNLTDTSVSSIISSKRLAGNATASNSYNYQAGYLQLGPDKRIYIARYQTHYLAVINYPDIYGSDCVFMNDGFFLGTNMSNAGLSRVPSRCSLPTSNFLSQIQYLTVSFKDSSSGADTWLWRFGDGTTSVDKDPLHTYSAPGEYSVSLRTENGCGSDSLIKTIIIACKQPVSDFVYYFDYPQVLFYDSSSTGYLLSRLWDFGDSTYSTDPNPVHSFGNAGIYIVCLTVTDSCGTSTRCDTLTYSLPLQVSIHITPSETDDKSVQFRNETIGTTYWEWNFGDGETSSLQNPAHRYKEYGTYQVCLTTGNQGESGTSCDTIELKVIPSLHKDNPVLIYPNPTSGKVEIELLSGISCEKVCTITNTYGVTILSFLINENEMQKSIDLSFLPDGTYIITIKDVDNFTYRSKVILIK
jgi:PKD repeat protein